MAKKTKSNLSGSDTNENIPKGTPTIKDGRSEPNPNKFYWWTVRFGVSATWVADGFDMDDDRALQMLAEHLSYAQGHELRGEVLHAPDPREVAGEQGYSTVEESDVRAVDYSARRRAIAKRAETLTNVFADELDRTGQNTIQMREVLSRKLRNMVELALCEETGVPWEASLRRKGVCK